MFVVAHHGIYAKTIVACSAWTGFCHVLFTYDWLSAGYDFVGLHDRGICSDQARANALHAQRKIADNARDARLCRRGRIGAAPGLSGFAVCREGLRQARRCQRQLFPGSAATMSQPTGNGQFSDKPFRLVLAWQCNRSELPIGIQRAELHSCLRQSHLAVAVC